MVTNRQRNFALAALAVAVLVVIWLIMRGGAYYVNAEFQTGGQLVKGANVTVGGKPVGKVESITLTEDNQANVKMRIDDSSLEPLHQGTTATIRLFSLSGVANRYVALQPGPNSAAEIPNKGVIKADNTEPPVDLDQVLNAFKPEVTKGLQDFLKGGAEQFADDPSTPVDEAVLGNRGLRWVAPFFDSAARLAAGVAKDDETLAQFLAVSARATDTLAGQSDQIEAMFTNLTRFTQAVSAESEELDRALAILPETLRQGTSAFAALRPTMKALENLSDKSDPIGEDLAPLFLKLEPLLDNAEPTLAYLRNMIRKKGANNDLTELFSNQPRLTSQAKRTFPNSTRALQSGSVILSFLRPYTPELTSWFTNLGQVSANYDANGHYIRAATQGGSFSYDGTNLTPNNNGSLPDYSKTGIDRCPGSGAQDAPDGSNPFTDGGAIDCNPSLKIPGP